MRVLLQKGKALSHVADARDARVALLEAAALARVLGDHDVLAEAAGLIASLPESGNVDSEQLKVLREALAVLPEDAPQRPLLLALLAKTMTYSAESEARVAIALDAIEQSKRVADPLLRAEVLHQCQRALPEVHHLGEREAITAELLRLGHLRGDYRVLGNAAIAQIQSCLERGNIASTDRAMRELEHIAAHAREPIFRWYSQVFRGMRLFVAGNIGEAIQASQEALRMGACVGDDTARQAHAMQVVGWYRVVGRLGECEALGRENMLRFPRMAAWRLSVAHAEADRGSYESAVATLADVMHDPASLDPFTHSLLAPLAELCGFFGTIEMTKTLYDILLPFAGRWGNIGFGVSTTGPIGRALAMLAIRAGDLDAAETHIEHAIASSVAAKSPTYESLALMTHARALLKRNDASSRERAEDALAASEAINRRYEFTGNSNMIRFMCRRAKLVLRAPEPLAD
jgi:tetratricopeptide (TPR) repeat protein